MRQFLAAIALFAAFSGGTASAQDTGTVVELYTSQGCASCPPADAILADLANRDGVIPLALHVDYWDYIGWADDLAKPAHSKRQRGYARQWNVGQVYTPQMVVAGVDDVVGSHPGKLMERLAAHAAVVDPVVITAQRADGVLTIAGQVRGRVPPLTSVQIVRYTPSLTRQIERGENAGKTIVYRNVVTEWSTVGTWMTAQPLAMEVPLEGDAPVVVIVQDGAAGPILGAVRLR